MSGDEFSNAPRVDARLLRRLSEEGKFEEVVKAIDGVDIAADLPPDFLYFAALGFAGTGSYGQAIDLLKRAAANGYSRFYCGLHLGMFESARGNAAAAAHYYTACLIAMPERSDAFDFLRAAVPDLDQTALRAAQAKSRSPEAARDALALGAAKQRLQKTAAAACYFTSALALDPDDRKARARLLQLVPDVSLAVLAGIDMDRLAARMCERLTGPAGAGDLASRLAWAEAAFEIYANTPHPSGRTVAPAIAAVLGEALAARRIDLDTLCLLHDKLYFLHWNWASSWEAMRGVADGAMKPLAAAVRDGSIAGLPAIAPRPIGAEPLRLAYMAEFALLGNPIGRGVGDLLELLARCFPGRYELMLYAWSQYHEEFLTALVDRGITVRRFGPSGPSERIAALAEAIAADKIDILITDMNSAVPAVLFERRAAPVQIFFQNGLPFWPLANIDGVFRIEFYDPRLDGFDPEMCFDLGLGAWRQHGYDYGPPVDPARVAAERARFPAAEKLIGIYGRLAKITPAFLGMLREVLLRHPRVVALVGGSGHGDWIREFIAEHGLAGRLVLVDEYVDGHIWGHMIDLFVDTSWDVTVAGREIMVKGKPIVALRTPTHERERVPMLIADDRAEYIEIVSRLIEDPDFYKAACAATRDFVAAQPGEREYAAAVDHAISTIVRRVKARADAAPRPVQAAEPVSLVSEIEIHTQHPIAVTSDDHKFPRGTKNDNTRHLPFAQACERIFGRKVRHLDLGCAGGGLVEDFLADGHFSIGIEGSDYSRVNRRAAWRTISQHLFTADITKPFRLTKGGSDLRFDVISAWELLEHLPENGLAGLIANIKAHLADHGIFVASVATFEDKDPSTGAVWNVTIKPRDWWEQRFRELGLAPCATPFVAYEYARGSGNASAHDWDAATAPHLGFHLVVRHSPAEPGDPGAAARDANGCRDRIVGDQRDDASSTEANCTGAPANTDCQSTSASAWREATTQSEPRPTVAGGLGAGGPRPYLLLSQLASEPVIDRLKHESRSKVEIVRFDGDERRIEIALASDVLYIPELHMQIWHDRIVPQETDTTNYALLDLRTSYEQDLDFRISAAAHRTCDDEVFILSNIYSHNFFHYTEQLYQVIALERVGFRGKYVLTSIGSNFSGPRLPSFQKDFLALLGIPPARVVDVTDVTLFRRVRFVTSIAHKNILSNPTVFLALRDSLLAAEAARSHSAGDRLWLSRRYRGIVNADEVNQCLERYGFKTVDMEALPLAQQIGIARSAEAIGGAHGAAMLHSMFMPPRRTVIECFSPKHLYPCIIDICRILDHRFFQLVQSDMPFCPYPHGEDVAVDLGQLELALRSLNSRPQVVSGTTTQPAAAKAQSLGRVGYRSVLAELKAGAPSRVTQVDFGQGGAKPVEIVAAGEVLYLPERHLQLWRGAIVPQEANFDPDAFDELRDGVSSGAIRLDAPPDGLAEVDGDVCILSNLYSNNFFHCFEELYKVVILERGGFRGHYVLSPFGDRHYPRLPPYATGFLELLGIGADRIIMCREPTLFRSSWLTTRIGCDEVMAYKNVFLALRDALIAAATRIAPGLGPRLYLERDRKRVVLNREEVRDCARRYGFTSVDMAALPIAQQIAAAHHAEVLLGAHGSGMLHCAFQQKKSAVIECFSPNFMDFFILDILHVLDHRYFQVVSMDRKAPVAYQHGNDIAVDCRHLELVLKQLG